MEIAKPIGFGPSRYPPAIPGWPGRVFISLAGSCYHSNPYCLLKAGQENVGNAVKS